MSLWKWKLLHWFTKIILLHILLDMYETGGFLNFCCGFISRLEERCFNHERDSPGPSIFLLSYVDTRLSISFCKFQYLNISYSTKKGRWLELNSESGVVSLCALRVCLFECVPSGKLCGFNSRAQVCTGQFAPSLLAQPTNNWSANWTWELFHVSTCVPV